MRLPWVVEGVRKEAFLERYVNSELGLSTWLPTDWGVTEEEERVIATGFQRFGVVMSLAEFEDQGGGIGLAEYVRDFLTEEGCKVHDVQELMIDGKPSVKCLFSSEEAGVGNWIYVHRGEFDVFLVTLAANDVLLRLEEPMTQSIHDGLRIFEPVVRKSHQDIVADILGGELDDWPRAEVGGKITTEEGEQLDVDLIERDENQRVQKFAVVARPATITVQKLIEWRKKLGAWAEEQMGGLKQY